VETDLQPLGVLGVLKEVEEEVGRVKTFRNGPRVVDLDLVLYNGEIIKVGQSPEEGGRDERWLEVPHPRLMEREFVLRPLAE
jgi:dihydroneopterin aldolase/2-amino-4-hydroxy-6-hydroxymethyldihydropteridine diphosphokinase/dihydropteroate synthase